VLRIDIRRLFGKTTQTSSGYSKSGAEEDFEHDNRKEDKVVKFKD